MSKFIAPCKNALAGNMYLKQCPQLLAERYELEKAKKEIERLKTELYSQPV